MTAECYGTEELREMCREAGIVGHDAQTAILAYRRALLAGRTEFGADAGRVAAVVRRHEYNAANAEPPTGVDPLAVELIKAFGGYDDLEWVRLEPLERDWLIRKGERAAEIARRYFDDC